MRHFLCHLFVINLAADFSFNFFRIITEKIHITNLQVLKSRNDSFFAKNRSNSIEKSWVFFSSTELLGSSCEYFD